MKDHRKAYRKKKTKKTKNKKTTQKQRDVTSKSEVGICFSEEECIVRSERLKVPKQPKENMD